MEATIIIGEALMYPSFSLLVGFLVINLIPITNRPEIVFPKMLRICCIVGLAIFTFAPILKLVIFLAGDMGILLTLKSVLTNFESGRVWSFTAGLTLFLLIGHTVPDFEKKRGLIVLSLFTMVGLAILVGMSSHAGSLVGWYGIILHSVHFLSMAIWSGILLLVGWFSKGKTDWIQSFLTWFSPVAFACVGIAIFTGLTIMQLVIEFKDYPQSWLLPYGQTILIKHLLIIPVLVFAIINGVLLKRMLKRRNDIRVLSRLRAEGIFILLIFMVTAILGTLSPPHIIPETLATEEPSELMEFIFSGQILPETVLQVHFQGASILLALLALGCLLMMVFLFLRKKPSSLAVLSGSLFVIFSYFSLMLSV